MTASPAIGLTPEERALIERAFRRRVHGSAIAGAVSILGIFAVSLTAIIAMTAGAWDRDGLWGFVPLSLVTGALSWRILRYHARRAARGCATLAGLDGTGPAATSWHETGGIESEPLLLSVHFADGYRELLGGETLRSRTADHDAIVAVLRRHGVPYG